MLNDTLLTEIDAKVAAMLRPTEREIPPHFDDGYDPFEGLDATESEEPPKPEAHPLAKFIDYDITGHVEPVKYVLDGTIEEAIVLVAGAAGAGKTSQMAPLVARCTHLVNDTVLRPLLRRKLIYVAEDPRQVIRLLASMRLAGEITCSNEEFREWFRIVQAKRLEPSQVIRVVSAYADLYTTNIGADGVTSYNTPPLVVFDTAAATFRLENENDNAQVSACISALKDHFGNIPVIIIAHTAKALKRGDLKDFSVRGAGAWEGDAQQVLYMATEDATDERFLSVKGGKHRFVTTVEGVSFSAVVQSFDSSDILGNPARDTVLHTIPKILRADDVSQRNAERMQAMEAEQELARKAELAELRQEIRDAVQIAWQAGNPINREGVKSKVGRNRAVTTAQIENLISEQWLYEVHIPSRDRTNSRRSAFLVNLTTEEHEAYIATGLPPISKLEVPQSWRKPSVPAADCETSLIKDSHHD